MVRAAMVAYYWPRALRASNWACPFVRPRSGVVASDYFPTVVVMAHCMEAYQAYTSDLPPQCTLYAYVDDIALQLVAPSGQLAAVAHHAVQALQDLLTLPGT